MECLAYTRWDPIAKWCAFAGFSNLHEIAPEEGCISQWFQLHYTRKSQSFSTKSDFEKYLDKNVLVPGPPAGGMGE